MSTKLIEYTKTETPGQFACKISIDELFESTKEKEKFFKKLPKFLNSDYRNQQVYQVDDRFIKYNSEELIPNIRNNRQALLLILGNPASHSIIEGMFFAFEGNKKEHRFWRKILPESGIVDLSILSEKTPEEKNIERRNQIINTTYMSQFQLGLSVFYSMPSGASDKWSGVAGITKLLGKRALTKLEQEEKKRLFITIQSFVNNNGSVLVFQKNAWENLKSESDPSYNSKIVNNCGIVGKVENQKTSLICVPPTRLSGPCSRVIKKCIFTT